MAWTKRMSVGMCAAGAGAGLLIALATAPAIAGSAPVAPAAAGGCSAVAHVDSQWATGQIVTVTVTNTAATGATMWSASWTLANGQSVASAWNASVTTSGGTVTAVNVAYNGSLAPGASTSFGMQLAGVAPAPAVGCTNDAVVPVSPSTSQSTGTGVTVAEADNGRTVTLPAGQTLAVSLPANYHPTAARGSALVLLSTSGGYPTGQPLVELYRAIAAGTADLTTQTDDPCLHATPPCAIPVRLWTVHVVVLNPSITLTHADSMTTVTVQVGQTIGISLAADFPATAVGGQALALLSTSGGYPTGQPLVELYRAQGTGSVDISTVSDFACLHTAPPTCARPNELWRVHVNVVGIGG